LRGELQGEIFVYMARENAGRPTEFMSQGDLLNKRSFNVKATMETRKRLGKLMLRSVEVFY
jgi:hypothetical protein